MNNRITVLVVEDLEVLRTNLILMLSQEEDIDVVGSAASGREAIALALKLTPEIILMDIEMETSRAGFWQPMKLLKHFPIPRSFLTMHEDEQTVIEAMSTGAVDYIFKTADCKNAELSIYEELIRTESEWKQQFNGSCTKSMYASFGVSKNI